MDPDRAEAFLPFRDPGVLYGRGRHPWAGSGSSYVQAIATSPGTGGVIRAARGSAGARDLDRELSYLRWAWAKGCFGPEVGDALSKLLVQLAPTGDSVAMKSEAVTVCDKALSVRDPADTRPSWDSIAARRVRTQQQLDKPPRQRALNPRNRRPPRPSRYYLRP